jgi:hypothetical protein
LDAGTARGHFIGVMGPGRASRCQATRRGTGQCGAGFSGRKWDRPPCWVSFAPGSDPTIPLRQVQRPSERQGHEASPFSFFC